MQIEHIMENGKSGVMIFPWGGKKPIKDFSLIPYFYAPSKTSKIKAVDGRTVSKILCKAAGDVREKRGEIHYDAKTPYVSRYWIDCIQNVETTIPIRMYLDIETASDGGMINNDSIRAAKEPVIIIGIYDSISRRVIQFCNHPELISFKTRHRELRVFKTEKEMFRNFTQYVAEIRPDIWIGFNSSGGFEIGGRRASGYDNPYIINRAGKIGVNIEDLSPLHQVRVNNWDEAKIVGVAQFDLLGGYLHLERRSYDSNTLDDVLEREMKVHKYKRKGFSSAYLKQAWEQDPDEVLEYNYWDVKRMVDWDEAKGITNAHIEFHKVFGCNLADTLYAGKSMEHYMRRKMPEFIFPSFKPENVGLLLGAAPRDPEKGLHEDVLFIDLTSAYPMSMMSGNMSFETILPEEKKGCININGVCFMQHDEKKGRFVQVIEELFQKKAECGELRSQYLYKSPEWKIMDNQRNAYKVGINTVYGHTGLVTSPFFNLDIANSVTYMTRGVIDAVEYEIKNMGYHRVFGHTDSVGFTTNAESLDEMIDIGNEAVKKLNDFFPMHFRKYNIKEEHAHMAVDFEKIAKRGIFAKKTRYALKLAWADGKKMDDSDESSMEIKGFDAIKSDSPRFSRGLQKELIYDALNGVPFRTIRSKFSKKLKQIENGEIPLMDVAIPSSLNKELKNYEPGYPRRVAAEWSNDFLGTGFAAGSKPFVLDTSIRKGFLGSTVNGNILRDTKYVAIDENTQLPPWIIVDYASMAKKAKKKLSYIFEPMGWRMDTLDGQKSLADFLSGP
ncbi:MAG: DNA polymerase domain-containing protein, partial [Candidatus Pacebacteria bacterium]|nr:DNA polymerase domain-containing protein [Candidatus Paceibacterota bacterium]